MAQKKTWLYLYTVILACTVLSITMGNSMLGLILGDIMGHYHISLDGGGLMSMYQNIGGTIGIILLTFLIDRINKPLFHMLPVFMAAACVLLIGTAPPYALFMMLFLLFGITIATVDVTSNAIIPDIHQEKRDALLSLLHSISPIGAILIPIVAGTAVEAGTPWQDIYTAVGILLLVVFVLYGIAYFKMRPAMKVIHSQQTERREKGTFKRFLKDKNVWLAALSIFLFAGYQGGVIVWITKYLSDVFNVGPVMGGIGVTAYWLGAGIVRFLFAVSPLKRLQTKPVLMWGGIAAGVALAVGILSGNYYVMMGCVFLSGCLNAPSLPRGVGLISGWYKENSGLASSLAFIGLYLAVAVVPLLMGITASALGMGAMMAIPALCTILSGVTAIFLPRHHSVGKEAA
ncbi:MAG: MFS transporter [Christensenellales bacterium]